MNSWKWKRADPPLRLKAQDEDVTDDTELNRLFLNTSRQSRFRPGLLDCAALQNSCIHCLSCQHSEGQFQFIKTVLKTDTWKHQNGEESVFTWLLIDWDFNAQPSLRFTHWPEEEVLSAKKTGNWGYDVHRLAKTSLVFCCNIQMVGSGFGINNMKAWVRLSVRLLLLLLVYWCGGDFLGTLWPLCTSRASFKHHSPPECWWCPLWPQWTHLLMTASSRRMHHVTKLKSSQTAFLNMTVSSVNSGLHSHRISTQ